MSTWFKRILFTLIIGLLVPEATPLISMLMLGNLLKVSGVVDRLSNAAQNEIINISTLFLGLAIGSTMNATVLGVMAFSSASASPRRSCTTRW